jgi:hypothetical protein
MTRYRINFEAMKAKSKAAIAAVEVGGVYFYSSFYDADGSLVKVLSKSELGRGGRAPSIECQVIEPLGRDLADYQAGRTYFAPGTIHDIAATNLYKNRADASHAAKFGATPEAVKASVAKLMSALTGVSTEKLATICNTKPPTPAQKAWATRKARA